MGPALSSPRAVVAAGALVWRERGDGVQVLLHARLVDVRRAGQALQAVRVQTKGGLLELAGRVFVDATGDADLSVAAGADVRQGRDADGLCQPMTANFRLNGVDMDRLKAEIRRRPENFGPINNRRGSWRDGGA